MASDADDLDKIIENLKNSVKKSFAVIYASLEARELKTLRQIEALGKQCQDNKDLKRNSVKNIQISYKNESTLLDNISDYGAIDLERLNFDSSVFTLDSPNNDYLYSYKCIEDLATVSENLATVSEDLATVSENLATVSEDLATVSEELGAIEEAALKQITSKNLATVSEDLATVSEDLATVSEDLGAIEEAALKQITSTANCVCYINIKSDDVSKKFRDNLHVPKCAECKTSDGATEETSETNDCQVTDEDSSDCLEEVKKIEPTDDWLNSLKSQTETEPSEVTGQMEHSTITCT